MDRDPSLSKGALPQIGTVGEVIHFADVFESASRGRQAPGVAAVVTRYLRFIMISPSSNSLEGLLLEARPGVRARDGTLARDDDGANRIVAAAQHTDATARVRVDFVLEDDAVAAIAGT